MKRNLILPLVMLLGIVGCNNNSNSSSTSSPSSDINVILDVPEEDKISPEQGDWVFTDYNDNYAEYNTDKW